jgi:hypothetical protein
MGPPEEDWPVVLVVEPRWATPFVSEPPPQAAASEPRATAAAAIVAGMAVTRLGPVRCETGGWNSNCWERFSLSFPVSFDDQQACRLERACLVPFPVLPLDRLARLELRVLLRRRTHHAAGEDDERLFRCCLVLAPITPSSVTSDTCHVSLRATRECVKPCELKW